MLITTPPPPEPVVSILGAERWLRAHGVRATRHRIYLALARGELTGNEIAPRVVQIKVSDLKQYADMLSGDGAVAGA